MREISGIDNVYIKLSTEVKVKSSFQILFPKCMFGK